ncbi:MAG: tail fiber domain-containing protein [bacterium]|nr:tail fiber domain-containing protein [bacterium]
MKKYNSISLIETLISLTIVGISIVALMPVMTVKKDTNDPTKGNISYWSFYDGANKLSARDEAYLIQKTGCPEGKACHRITKVSPATDTSGNMYPVSIGIAKLPEEVAPARPRNFMVYARGLSSSGFIPLYVANKLNYKGEQVISENPDGGYLHLIGGEVTEDVNWKCAPKNLYVDASNVIIENTSSVSSFNLCFDKRFDDKITYNYYPQRNDTTAGELTNIYSIKTGTNDDEYMHVDAQHNIIGVGHNSVKFFNPTKISNSVIIATFGNPTAISGEEFSGLAIGNLTYSDTPEVLTLDKNNYIIYKSTLRQNLGVDPVSGDPIMEDNTENINIRADLETGSITAQSYIAASDARLKNITGKYEKGLKYILRLNPVEYTYKSDKNKEHHIGVIAQDLKKIFSESVFKNSDTGYLSINTDGIFYALLNSIKELNAKNQELKKQNDELEAKIAELRKIRDDMKMQRGGQNNE